MIPLAKITLEQIKETLKPTGYTCVSSQYVNLKTLMEFRCPEGHLITTTWDKMRKKQSCPVCKDNLKKKIVNVDAKSKDKTRYRILALDQSSRKTGYSVYDNNELISYGVFESTKYNALDRIVEVCDWMQSMIELWKPDEVGLEETQYNPRSDGHNTFKLLSQVMGAIMLTVARNKCKVNTVLIPTWRHHCGVKGNKRVDQKRSAQLLVKKWYDITVTDDESDAICIGKYFSDNHQIAKPGIGEEWQEI